MNAKNCVRLSFLSLTQRGIRSALTVLGIVIGIAALISLVGISEGAKQSIESRLSDLGTDIITITPGHQRATGFTMQRFGGSFRSTSSAKPLTERDLLVVLATPGVETATPIFSGRVDVSYLNEDTSLSVQGVDPVAWKEITTSTLAEGRFLNPSDPNAVVVGYGVAHSVFDRELQLNSQLEVEGKLFRVVGILEQAGMGGSDNTIIMEDRVADDLLEADGEYSSIEAKISDPDTAEDMVTLIEERLRFSRAVTEDKQDFTVTSPASLSQQVEEVTSTMNIFMAAVAGISLLVGALGIANTMYMSVLERTRQIGLMKSLGSTDAEVLKLFLFESAFLGFLGGLIGIFVGFLISWGISSLGVRFMGQGGSLTSVVTPGIVLFALVFSVTVGAVSGFFPARKAASLEPVEALRYE